MIDKNNLIIIVGLIVSVILFLIFMPTFNFGDSSSSTFGTFGQNNSKNEKNMPATLKWGNDFNHKYKKLEKERPKKSAFKF